MNKFEIGISSTDWTIETIKNQLTRQNIQLNLYPQDSDWTIEKKSRFIESLILGFPIPQIVLVEEEKGKYIVLDGKERLLTILQFYGATNSPDDNFELKKLSFLGELEGLQWQDLGQKKRIIDNYPLRTTIVKNCYNDSVLSTIYQRLNSKD